MLILSAGMPRSGSTWLYNAMRLLLARRHAAPAELACAWIDDFARMPAAQCQLVKLHEYDAALAARAEFVAYSYRDLRDAMASLVRKFQQVPSLSSADHLVEQHRLWTARADCRVRYENMLNDPEREVERLASAMGLGDADAAGICTELTQLSHDTEEPRNGAYNELTLMHRGHVTDGRVGSWTHGLPATLEREIVARHADFFRTEAYATDPVAGTGPHA